MDIYLFSGTHWDREWYQDFQGFRFRLVEMMDDLIDELETDPRYGVFHLDGQTIMLEDYLAIRPDNRTRLKRLIQNGKIQVGPWYVMPDEFLVSGESLIKNLQKGHAIARSFGGEPLKFGYLCDVFGHIAQMPQILEQIDIHHALLGRGTNEHTTPAFFCWQSPDGSAVTTFKLPDKRGYTGYCIVRSCNNLRQTLKEMIEYESGRSDVPIILLMDANDHQSCDHKNPDQLDVIREIYPNARVHHQSVMDMCHQLDQGSYSLPVKKGEIREPAKVKAPYLHLITHTLSSRYPLKKWNDILQSRLEKVVQPLYAFGHITYPLSYLDMANDYLLQNQSHDSICGCSIDRVHQDMIYRYHQADSILNELTHRFSFSMAQKKPTDEKVLKLYNPLPYEISRVIEAQIPFEPDYPTHYEEPFGYEKVVSFRMYDKQGQEIPYGIIDIRRGQIHEVELLKKKKMDIYRVSLSVRLRPAGFTQISIRPSTTPSRYLNRLSCWETGAENEWIRLQIRADGSLDLTDKETGRTYHRLLSAVDDGEIGDGWYHANPVVDRTVTNTHAIIERLETSSVQCTFCVTQILQLPAKIDKFKRSVEQKEFRICHYITLARGERHVAVSTKINNNVLDHRLRLKFPTGIANGRYFANQPFCFVERRTGIDCTTQDWEECEVLEKQMGGIVLTRDQTGGFAFISKYGLHECAVTDSGDIYVTLLRAFCKTVHTNGEPDGQLQQELEYSYLLVPFGAEQSLAALQKKQDAFQTQPLQCVYNGTPNPDESVDLCIDSDCILLSTAVRDSDAVYIRVYNMSENTDSATITLPSFAKSAELVNLEGKTLESLNISNGKISLTLDGYRFATIRIAD
jgi:alpha-mannosidase